MSQRGNYKTAICTNKLLDYHDFVDFSPLFVETGSCSGAGIQRAINAGFHRVKSVEAMPEYHRIVTEKFKDNNLVQLYFGSSPEVLPKMIERLNYPAVFFLDAHPAGPGTAGHDEILSGDVNFGQDAIITAELKVILSHRNDHLIIIDDQDYGSNESEAYMNLCLAANSNYSFEWYDENIGQFRQNKILVCRP